MAGLLTRTALCHQLIHLHDQPEDEKKKAARLAHAFSLALGTNYTRTLFGVFGFHFS